VAGFARASTTPAQHVKVEGTGTVDIQVVNSNQVPDGHVFHVTFAASDTDSVRAESYALVDSTTGEVLFANGHDFVGVGNGPVGDGLLPIVATDSLVRFDAAASGFIPGSPTNSKLRVSYQPLLSPNLRRPGYPEDFQIRFASTYKDTSIGDKSATARPAKFEIFAHEATGDRKMKFYFRDLDNNGVLSRQFERIDIVTYRPSFPNDPQATWRVELDTTGLGPNPLRLTTDGDVFEARLRVPLTAKDLFSFRTVGQQVAAPAGGKVVNEPYVVPNPYVGAASFEPGRFATSGRGERRIEFRGIPQGAVVRIYTVRGDLVQTLRQDGSSNAFVPWDLRSKDNLDVAPGLYVFQVEAPGADPKVGKFALLK
jgi:hypothetical protein